MEDRILGVVSAILRVPRDTLTTASSPDTLDHWDSLRHLQLVLALEEEFGLQFRGEEIDAMQSVGGIISILREHLDGDAGR